MYQPGHIYLVKASSDRFWWELKQYQQVEVITRPLSNTLQQELEYTSPFAEERVVAILPNNSFDLPPSLKPSQNVTAFVWMCMSNSSMSSKAEKAYKSLAGGAYIQVDLHTKKEADEPEIATYLNRLRAETEEELTNLEEKITALLERFREKPCRLLMQLQQADPFRWIEPDLRKEELARAIDSLGKPESLRLWRNISSRTLYSYLIEPTSMGVGSKDRVPFGMPPSIWVYMQIFIDRLMPAASNNLQIPLKLFATWVYLATNRWADRTGRGIYEFTYRYGKFKGKTGIGFEPSVEAIAAFERLLNS